MEKRITSIILENFRGYWGEYPPIQLQNGENLLIYGENGSGKSSLYKALNSFLLKSIDLDVEFIKNSYNKGERGQIKVQFSDYDSDNKTILEDTNISYTFSDNEYNADAHFVKETALIKGFLDYTDLLNVYFHKESQPNLFQLIVFTLLGEHIPITSGGSFKFREKWKELEDSIITRPYTINEHRHRTAKAYLPIFETHLRASLDEIFEKLNKYLVSYFPHFNIELEYFLCPIQFEYAYRDRSKWKIKQDLRLLVKKDGQTLLDGYNDSLNEARLSAIAVSLYLSALRVTNKHFAFKILYLDDVFIGLDSGNRIPILNILSDEFDDFQIFISTYDRHWFELAKRHFLLNKNSLWKTIELYVGYQEDHLGNRIDKPIIVTGESYFDKAIKYLHHNSNPDYPAAANYFRKALEELISTYLPKYELIDGDYTQIPEYKLSNLAYRAKRFLNRIGCDSESINIIISLLHILIHPLSHHEIASPIYKSELLLIENAFLKLYNQLSKLEVEKFQCKLERESKIKIKFLISTSPRHSYEYDLKLKDSIILHKTEMDTIKLPTHCFLTKMTGIKDDVALQPFSPTKEDIRFNYSSLVDAVNKLYSHLISNGVSFPAPIDYLDSIEYFEINNWKPIKELLVWKG